ncbi:hypothetical protein [Bifidobacterium sp. UTCIF-39]|uniref:hypothetical protein n=1 Tax=Bifidobacterium sp. UTCIF-39 TaxID=1465359 RepID=UPI0021597343|nr:hypothetical protein [Bifidobacterium sp. UTCIF-39]
MATRELKTPGLAKEAGIPYGTLRKILELNTVADYEQLRKIAIALRMPLSEIVSDAERLSLDPGIVEDYMDSSVSGDARVEEALARVRALSAGRQDMGLAALHDPHKLDPDDNEAA